LFPAPNWSDAGDLFSRGVKYFLDKGLHLDYKAPKIITGLCNEQAFTREQKLFWLLVLLLLRVGLPVAGEDLVRNQ
jgi:hypothetical protein